MKRLFWVVPIAFGLLMTIGYIINISLPKWALTPRKLSGPVIIDLRKGEKLSELAEELQANELIDSTLRFRLWIRYFKDYGKFQAGRYRFEGQLTPAAIVEAFQSGKTWSPFELQFVIPEGFTLKQVIERLVAREVGTRAELEAIARDPELLAKYRIAGENVEGYLFPATYTFEIKPSPNAVFDKMLQTFFQALPADFEARAAARKLDLHRAVIFASLIEKETMLDDEMPQISEVIWNRLKLGEPLGIDAALIYGIPNYKGDITWKHLRDSTNRYNTRIHKGLPPGPIGAISMRSLEAVLQPSQEGYHFYVLANDKSGTHHFTRTLEEHNRYVKQLIRGSQ